MSLLLELRGLAKSFRGVRALSPLDLDVDEGQVIGLVGENGAGKSTLIKLLSGVHSPDRGSILWQGTPVRFASPREAMDAGIATIHQELAYFAGRSVAENLLLGESWPRRLGVRWRELRAEARRRLEAFDLDLDPRRVFRSLSTAEKQEVAMARALGQRSRLLILDEPTASLSGPEVERLFGHLERLRRQGVALLYVSHRLDEVLRLSDRIAVLRDGELVADNPASSTDASRLVRDMVGRDVDVKRSRSAGGSGEQGAELLAVEGLTRRAEFTDVSLKLRAGEVLGLAGLVGAGRSELARVIYGLLRPDAGRMRLHGREWRPRGPWESLQQGLVYLPEERKKQAFVLDHSLGDSISIGFADRLRGPLGTISRRAERRAVGDAIDRYAIRATGHSQPIGTLSGGNQQKAVLARWLGRDPDVLILDEPTRGVDVGAKAEIHRLIREQASRGKAVLMISSDIPEVAGTSDRVLVMRTGRISAELSGDQVTEEAIAFAAIGVEGRGAVGDSGRG